MIRILIIEEHDLWRNFMIEELSSHPDLEVVGAGVPEQLWNLVSADAPDIVVLDVYSRDGAFHPISTVEALQRQYPDVKVLIFAGSDSVVFLQELIKRGARGYVRKDDHLAVELPDCIRAIAQGGSGYSLKVKKMLGLRDPS